MLGILAQKYKQLMRVSNCIPALIVRSRFLPLLQYAADWHDAHLLAAGTLQREQPAFVNDPMLSIFKGSSGRKNEQT